MPLSQKVIFKTKLQSQNRLQVPKLVRWKYKLDSKVLKVIISIANAAFFAESFYAELYESGRIRVLGLTMAQLKRNKTNLDIWVLNITLGPI